MSLSFLVTITTNFGTAGSDNEPFQIFLDGESDLQNHLITQFDFSELHPHPDNKTSHLCIEVSGHPYTICATPAPKELAGSQVELSAICFLFLIYLCSFFLCMPTPNVTCFPSRFFNRPNQTNK